MPLFSVHRLDREAMVVRDVSGKGWWKVSGTGTFSERNIRVGCTARSLSTTGPTGRLVLTAVAAFEDPRVQTFLKSEGRHQSYFSLPRKGIAPDRLTVDLRIADEPDTCNGEFTGAQLFHVSAKEN